MSASIKTKEDIELLRESGKRLATVLKEVSKHVVAGKTPRELDALAKRLIEERGDKPSFLGYTSRKSDAPYPASTCISVNDGIVHGMPLNDIPFEEGDLVGLDIGVNHKGRFTDMAVTLPVGEVSKEAKRLLQKTKESLDRAINVAKEGNTVGDIGYAVESFVGGEYGIIRGLAGHGVGYKVHEDPFIPNFGEKGKGEKLKRGMVLALEPMLTMGGEDLVVAEDGYTYKTKDGSLSAHFEHTILITEGRAEILTKID